MARVIALQNDNDQVLLDGARAKDTAVVIGGDRIVEAGSFGFDVVFGPDTLGGSVVFEAAPFVGYPGAWAPLKVVRWLAPHASTHVRLEGPLLALRIRVLESVIGEGVISVYGTAQE